MNVRASRASTLALRLRIPAWCPQAQAIIRINGERSPASIENGFATLRRVWKDGDRIELDLGLTLRPEAIDPNPPALTRKQFFPR